MKRRSGRPRADMRKFGLEPGPKSRFKDLELEGPKSGSVGWHREAGYFQVDPEVWGLIDLGVFCRPVEASSCVLTRTLGGAE